jgi:hypothetical protein
MCLTERRYSIEWSLLVDSVSSKRKSCRHEWEKNSERAKVLCPHFPQELRKATYIRHLAYMPNSNLEFSKIRSMYINGCVSACHIAWNSPCILCFMKLAANAQVWTLNCRCSSQVWSVCLLLHFDTRYGARVSMCVAVIASQLSRESACVPVVNRQCGSWMDYWLISRLSANVASSLSVEGPRVCR